MPIITPAFLRAAHRRGWPVHAWTIDEPQEMQALLQMGVQGIITDRPTVLKDVLSRWPQDNVRDVSGTSGGLAPDMP